MFLKKKLAGFSLLELMVVVAILGVLATVAVPRFNIFRARARQAEAKSNMGVIFTLQESFAIEHESYYDGKSATWGGTDMSKAGEADGYRGGGTAATATVCRANKLGFRLANCGKARYGYFMNGAGENGFLAIAHAPSDTNLGGKRIFPGCDGSGAHKQADTTTAGRACVKTHTVTGDLDKFGIGDAWCLDERRELVNYRDITEYCTN